MAPGFPPTVRARLNFAADRNDGGRFSNSSPDLTDQNNLVVTAEVTNIRTMPTEPTLETEGVTLRDSPAGHLPWSNEPDCITKYVTACCDLIRSVTGLDTIPFGPPVRRGGTPVGTELVAPKAHFVHLDNTRSSASARIEDAAVAHGLRPENAVIFNVWRSVTPPPQDCPLAVADRRTVPEADFVPGITVEPRGFAAPHLRLAAGPAPGCRWYYAPDLAIDEVLIFVGADLDPNHSFGCAHSAFLNPLVADTVPPRESVEMRIIACYP